MSQSAVSIADNPRISVLRIWAPPPTVLVNRLCQWRSIARGSSPNSSGAATSWT
jgi:hypothetical protein